MGSGSGAIWGVAFHLRDAGFIGTCSVDCRTAQHRNRGLSDGACAALDSATDCVADRNVGRDSERHFGSVGNIRDDSMAPTVPVSIAEKILRLDAVFYRTNLRNE